MIPTTSREDGMTCALDPDSLADRLRHIALLAHRHLLYQEQEGLTLRLQYASKAAAQLRQLATLEGQCCAFLDFELHEKADRIEVVVSAPPEAAATAWMLFSYLRGETQALPGQACAGSGCGCPA